MKKILLLVIIFFAIFNESFSQEVIKFRAKYMSYKAYDEYGWRDWSDWKDVNILVVLEPEDERITVYAAKTHTLDLYDYDSNTDGDNSVLLFKAIDENGSRCRVRFVYDEYSENRQLYIDYSNFIITYAVKSLR